MNFLDIVSCDLTKEIVQNLDVKSFSKFLSTCKYAHENTKTLFTKIVVENIKNVLEEIINSIKTMDTLISEEDTKYHITQMICKAYFQNMINGENTDDRDYLLTLTEEPIMKILEQIDGTLQDIHIVWNQIANEKDVDEQYGKQVVKCIQEHLFKKEYNVVFELVNNKDNQIKYKFIFNITLSQTEPLMKVIIVDEENEIDLCDNQFVGMMNNYITDVDITIDGELEFKGTENNLRGFVEYLMIVFGNGIFTNTLSNNIVQIHLCNFVNQPYTCCDFYRKTVYDLQITKDISKRIMEKIKSNTV